MSILADGVSTQVVSPSSTFQGDRNGWFCSAAHHRGALYTVASVLETCGCDLFVCLFVLVVFPQSTKLYKSV